MFTMRYAVISGVVLVASGVALACGGVDVREIRIVNEDGGAAGAGNTAGTRPSGGSSSGTSPGSGGDNPQGEAGADGQAGEASVPVLPEPPVVVAITPEAGEDEVEPTGTVRIEFSEGLDPSTVTGDSVQVLDGETAIPGELSYSGVTVEFTPDERLDLLREYSVVVTTDVTDAAGTALNEEFSSSFVVRDGQWREELLVQNTEGALTRRLVSPVTDARGNALIVWGQTKPGESVGSVFGRYFSPDQGFGAAFEIDTATVACDDMSLAMNAAGEAIVAWSESRNGGEEVWARRIKDGALDGAPQRVDVAAVTVDRIVSAVSASGEAHVLWSFDDSVGATKANILSSHAAPGEAWLSTPEIIHNYADTLSAPAIAFDEDDNGFVFFALESDTSDQVPGRLFARRYLSTTGRWGSGIVIDGSDGVQLYDPPSVVSGDGGVARALFAAGPDVKSVSFTKASGFGAAAIIDALDLSPSSQPQIATNGRQFLAVWYQSVSVNTNAYSSMSQGGAFAPPELRSSGDVRVGAYGNAVSGLDRLGNGLVLFEQTNATNTVDILFGRLSAESGKWVDGALVNSLEGEYQDPRLSVAPNGVAVAAWSVGIRLSPSSIYVTTFE